MLIDFNSMQETRIGGMEGGSGEMFARMYADSRCRIVSCRLTPGSSIGSHVQKGSNDANYVISGRGKAICDGVTEELVPGVCHICPAGSTHSIVNDGDEDLVLFTFVQRLD